MTEPAEEEKPAVRVPVMPWEVFSYLKLPDGRNGRWMLTHESFKPGHEFQITTLRDVILGAPGPGKITTDTKLRIHRLSEIRKGETDPKKAHLWMSDHPAEVWSHVQHLKDFRGRVLVGGLGIGLAVTYLERHPFVKEIVVVEKSRSVCQLVWPHLKLKTRKTRLVNKCLFKYLSQERRPMAFDFAFYDIWRESGEHTLWNCVMPLRMLSRWLLPSENVRCWKEDTMLGQVRLSIDMAIQMRGIKLAEKLTVDLFKLPDDEFLRAREMLGPKWAFYNWARQTNPSKEALYHELPGFVTALTDYDAWHDRWAQFYGLEIKQGDSKCGY